MLSILALLKEFELKRSCYGFGCKIMLSSGDGLGPGDGRGCVDGDRGEGASRAALNAYTWDHG